MCYACLVDGSKRTKSDKSRHRKAQRRARLRAARESTPGRTQLPAIIRSPDKAILEIGTDPIGYLDFRREVLRPRRARTSAPRQRPEYLGWGVVTVGSVGVLAYLASKLGDRRRG
jgi:hypothetical protein